MHLNKSIFTEEPLFKQGHTLLIIADVLGNFDSLYKKLMLDTIAINLKMQVMASQARYLMHNSWLDIIDIDTSDSQLIMKFWPTKDKEYKYVFNARIHSIVNTATAKKLSSMSLEDLISRSHLYDMKLNLRSTYISTLINDNELYLIDTVEDTLTRFTKNECVKTLLGIKAELDASGYDVESSNDTSILTIAIDDERIMLKVNVKTGKILISPLNPSLELKLNQFSIVSTFDTYRKNKLSKSIASLAGQCGFDASLKMETPLVLVKPTFLQFKKMKNWYLAIDSNSIYCCCFEQANGKNQFVGAHQLEYKTLSVKFFARVYEECMYDISC